MPCEQLASTGLDAGVILLVAAAAIILFGAALLFARRTRAAVPAVFVVLVLLALAGGATAPASAAAADCVLDPGPTQSLSVEQTSAITGMAPNRPPDPIAGLVTNTGTDDTYIVDVVVSIASITRAPGASAGTCDASDYVLVAPRMPVGSPLAGGQSVTFSGASIGFRDKDTNQDACQGATVTLLYRVG